MNYIVWDDDYIVLYFLPNTLSKLPNTFNILQTEKQNDKIHMQGGIS